jgi:hypothetical protein
MQRRTEPALTGELGEANTRAGIQIQESKPVQKSTKTTREMNKTLCPLGLMDFVI